MSLFQTNAVVFDDGTALDAVYREDVFVERSEIINEYAGALEPALQHRAPKDIVLDGEAGTGKTATTKYIMEHLRRELAKQNRTLTTAHIEVSEDTSAFQTLIKLVSALRTSRGEDPLSSTGYAYAGVKRKLHAEIERLDGVVYIIVDEADHITNPDKLFRDLSRLPDQTNTPDLGIGIIAIGNDVSFLTDQKASTASTFRPASITFPPYTQDEIETILRRRAEQAFAEDAITEVVIKQCTGYCMQAGGGDIRYGLKLLAEAGEQARLRIRNELAETEPRRITVDDIETAKAELTPLWFDKAVQNLSEEGLRVLVAVTAKAANDKTPCRTKELYEGYQPVNLNDLSQRRFRDYLHRLAERSVLHKRPQNNGRNRENPGQFDEYELGSDVANTLKLLCNIEDISYVSDGIFEYICENAVKNGYLTNKQKGRLLAGSNDESG